MSDELFSFGKQSEKVETLRKTVQEILLAYKNDCSDGWYFIATVITPPQAIIIQQQFRILLKVNEFSNPESILTVQLSEHCARNFLNIIKINQTYRFKNGLIIIRTYESNFVFMAEASEIFMIEYYSDLSTPSNSISQNKAQIQEKKSDPSKRKTGVEIQKISAKSQSNKPKSVGKNHQSVVLSNLEKESPTFKSLQYENKGGNSMNIRKEELEYADFKAKVLCQYAVGKNKMNKGTGYQVEQVDSNHIYEVVVWEEVKPVPPLIRGKTYQFKSFKVHRKRNYLLSFHSHFQHSYIQELN